MIRDILRTIGAGCLLAGGILYITAGYENSTNTGLQQMKDQIADLQNELTTTKEELAIAQTASSAEADQPTKGKDDSNHTDTASSPNHFVLTIESGSNSTIVATALERGGMVKNAAEFDAYLARNGLSGKIQIGDHEIDSSMDYSAIARKITTPK